MKLGVTLFVEGDDDRRWANKTIVPLLQRIYVTVHVIAYSELSAKKVSAFLKTFIRLGYDVYVVSDFDKGPCISSKRTEVANQFGVDIRQVIVAVREIEAWYLAGVSLDRCAKCRYPLVRDTSNYDKQMLHNLAKQLKTSPAVLKINMLGFFSLKAGIERNASLAYFVARLGLPQ